MNRDDFPLIAAAGSTKADCCLDPRERSLEGLIYLDNAATMQKPRAVLDAVRKYYETENANPLRGLYSLSVQATELVEIARAKVANFIGAKDKDEIIFTSGATDSLNIAAMWCSALSSDDEIIISMGEHHSNFLPWMRIAEATGAHLRLVDCEADGTIKQPNFERALTPNTRVVALNYIGNVYGGENRIKKLFNLAHQHSYSVLCVLDAAQAVAHRPVNVSDLDADILAFSGHKMGAPMGIGVLYAKKDIIRSAPPVNMGGEMVERVEIHPEGIMTEFAKGPHKFEAGTLNVGGTVGLSAAIDYFTEVGLNKIFNYERDLTDYAAEKLAKVAKVYGHGHGIIAFNIPGVHPHDTAQLLANEGIAVRAGWHCAQPLLESHEIGPVVRASLSFYNTKEEIDKLTAALQRVQDQMEI